MMNSLDEQNNDIQAGNEHWVAVMETLGASNTGLVLEHLRSNGVQAVAFENSSLALLTGANSSAVVLVPLAEVGSAMELLYPTADLAEDEEIDADDEAAEVDSEGVSDIGKLVLGVTAVALSPIGAGIAYAISRGADAKSDFDENEVECPHCGAVIELSEEELIEGEFTCPVCSNLVAIEPFVDNVVECPNCQESVELSPEELAARKFVCPACREPIDLDDYAVCPRCDADLDLDEAERTQGWYICPECNWAIPLAVTNL